ncbi:hypothetical protein [Maridesulfovibrio sp.]|uniref:hypothetical protein n=1 Tax=Maridesulfovibrio sp. TaxID=2795000 RepID=UPI003BABA9A7
MKHLKIMIMAALVTLLLGGSAFAQNTCGSSGSVMLPRVVSHYESPKYQMTAFFLTNTSNSDVDCTFKIYDHNGNRVRNKLTIQTGNISSATYGPVVAQNVDTFTLPAKSSRRVTVSNIGIHLIGYGSLEWCSQEPSLATPLIGSSQYFYRNGDVTFGSEYLINDGRPF